MIIDPQSFASCGIFALDRPRRCSHFVLMARTIKTLGQAAQHRMLVRSRCRKCDKAASFTAGSLAGIFGHGREIRSLKFRCKDCNSTDCEVLAYEDILKPKAWAQPVQVQIDTSENGTIGGLIDHGYTLWAFCQRPGCNHASKIDLQMLAKELGRNHSAMHKVLAPKLKCSACGSRQLDLSATPY